MRFSISFIKTALFSAVLLSSTALCGQTGKTKTTPPKTTTPKTSPSIPGRSVDPAVFAKTAVDSLRKTGLSDVDIAKMMKTKTGTKNMVIGLKKTPARATVAGSSGRSGGSTPPPPPAFSAEDEADAVEMAQILDETGDGRHFLTTEELSVLWEVYEIPDLATFLRILDSAGLIYDRNIVDYMYAISRWIPTLASSATTFAAPDWRSQYPAFYDLCLAHNITAGQAFLQFTVRTYVNGQIYNPPSFFTVTGDARKALVLSEIVVKYNCTEQVVLRSAMEKSEIIGQTPGEFIRNENTRSAKTVEYWAAMLKLDDVPNSNGGAYPAFTATQATSILNAAGFTTIQVTTAIRAVYQ